MTPLSCTLLGQDYTLGCPEGGEALMHMAVQMVSEELAGIQQAGRVKSRERMAVLAALNVAYKLAEQLTAPPPAPAPTLDPLSAQGLVDGMLERLTQVLAHAEAAPVTPATLVPPAETAAPVQADPSPASAPLQTESPSF